MYTMITSEFRSINWFVQVFIAVIALVFIGMFMREMPALYHSGDWGRLLLAIALICALVVIYFYRLNKDLKTLTVTEEGINVYYLLTRKEVTILYADIVSISNFISSGDGRGASFTIRTCAIELVNGDEFSFNDIQYDNYTELKDNIWRLKHNVQ